MEQPNKLLGVVRVKLFYNIAVGVNGPHYSTIDISAANIMLLLLKRQVTACLQVLHVWVFYCCVMLYLDIT